MLPVMTQTNPVIVARAADTGRERENILRTMIGADTQLGTRFGNQPARALERGEFRAFQSHLDDRRLLVEQLVERLDWNEISG